MNDKAMFKIGYGLYILTASENGRDNGCIVNTLVQVTSSPNRVMIAVNKANYTAEMISRTKAFNVSMLTVTAKMETIERFGFQSGRTADKFENFPFARAANGIPYVRRECNAYLCCNVLTVTDLGTHLLFLAEVVDGDVTGEDESLTYAYYHANIKPKPQAQAKKGWRCTICNYVYEHVEDNTTLTVRYTNVFPQNRLFNWTHVGRFRPDQNILMHSVMYRTEVLRKCGMVLPKHTFYVDNIFVYQPLPYVKSMYYMDLDLYRYFIGRADQSVNESIMVKRVDQQLRVTRHMIDCQDLDELKDQKRLHAYMVHYLSVMMAVSDIFLLLDGSDEAKAKRTGLWQYLKDHVSTGVYRAVRYNLGGLTDLKFPGGDKLTLGVYRQLRKVFKFN